MKIKTIDITAKEWFDRVNGNSYFSAQITINYGMKTRKIYKLPYQYGYGNHFTTAARDLLNAEGLINNDPLTPLWRICDDMKIILRTTKIENCRKRDMVAWGN